MPNSPVSKALRATERSASIRPRFRATPRLPFQTKPPPVYFRKPYGPGWALVGDAGHDQDPLTGQGISDAFTDAETLAEALDAGFSGARPLDAALADYQSRRDQRAKPMYHFTCELAKLEPPPPLMQQLFAALHEDQAATNQVFAAITGSLPLPAFMSDENIGRIIGTARGAARAGQ